MCVHHVVRPHSSVSLAFLSVASQYFSLACGSAFCSEAILSSDGCLCLGPICVCYREEEKKKGFCNKENMNISDLLALFSLKNLHIPPPFSSLLKKKLRDFVSTALERTLFAHQAITVFWGWIHRFIHNLALQFWKAKQYRFGSFCCVPAWTWPSTDWCQTRWLLFCSLVGAVVFIHSGPQDSFSFAI